MVLGRLLKFELVKNIRCAPLQRDELFFDPRLSALIYRLQDILLLIAKHLYRRRTGTGGDKRNASTFSHVKRDTSYQRDRAGPGHPSTPTAMSGTHPSTGEPPFDQHNVASAY
jgi:hypothetical protein